MGDEVGKLQIRLVAELINAFMPIRLPALDTTSFSEGPLA